MPVWNGARSAARRTTTIARSGTARSRNGEVAHSCANRWCSLSSRSERASWLLCVPLKLAELLAKESTRDQFGVACFKLNFVQLNDLQWRSFAHDNDVSQIE